MKLLTINGVDIANPTKYDLTFSDLDSSGTSRSVSGVLHRERVRSGILKLSLAWEMLSYDEMTTIMNATSGESFTVNYFYGTSTMKSAVMYAGDKVLSLAATNKNNILDTRWNLSINLISY